MRLIRDEDYTPQLQAIVSCIKETANPEKICLTGTITAQVQTDTIFSDTKESWQTIIQFDLLILTSPTEKTKKTILQDAIETRCRRIVPVTTIIMSIEEFNTLAADAHPFAIRIYHHARLVYDAQTIPLVLPPYKEADVQELKNDFCHWSRLAGGFLMGADMYISSKQFRHAVLLLHQAAEHLYVAILQLHTGYRFATHNLDKLYRYSRALSKDLYWLFPQHTDEEKRLFRLLQQGYIDARYSKEFRIREAELQKLAERVRQLQSITRSMCRKHFRTNPQTHQLPNSTKALCSE